MRKKADEPVIMEFVRLWCMDRCGIASGRMARERLSSSPSGTGAVAIKPNARRCHHTSKRSHRARNSAAYDATLRQRGSLTVRFTHAAIAAWKAALPTTRREPAASLGRGHHERANAARDSPTGSEGRRRPSKPTMEPIRPSAGRWARRNTARRVSAIRIASGDCQDCPPRVVRVSAARPRLPRR